jgi:YVTN family beta-propeller protein
MLVMGLWATAWPSEALARTGQPLAYVTGSDTISVIDTGNNAVVATILLKGAQLVAIAPDGKHAYVTTLINGLVVSAGISVIDTTANDVVATIPLGELVSGIAITPDGSRVYVAAESLTTNNVFVIGAATNTVLTTIPVDAHYVYAGGIAVSPDGKRIYYGTGADGKHAYAMIDAPSRDGEFVEVIDTVANNLTGTVRLDALAHGGIAITPDGTRVYVNVIFRRDGSRGVSVIETATNAVAANINISQPAKGVVNPIDVAITPDGKHAYVTTEASSVLVIDTVTNSIIKTIAVPAGAGAIAIIPPPQGVQFLSLQCQARHQSWPQTKTGRL